MKTFCISFLDMDILCVGYEDKIANLYNYVELHSDPKNQCDIVVLVNRIVDNGIYAHAIKKKKNFDYKTLVINTRMKKENLYMTKMQYYEALIICYPQEMKEALRYKSDAVEKVLKHSIWKTRFKY